MHMIKLKFPTINPVRFPYFSINNVAGIWNTTLKKGKNESAKTICANDNPL